MRINSPVAKALMISLCILLAHSKIVTANEQREKPLLFLGNHNLPPMIYKQRDQEKHVGIVVDIAEAISKKMRRPVRFEYMDWTEAQQLVLEGKADALFQINPTDARRDKFDFSGPLLESKFSIFVPYEKENIFSINGLRGLKVGVEEKGAPIEYITRESSIESVIISDVVIGFKLLADKKIDAVVVDQWVGAYVIAENHLNGIRIAGEPIAESISAIAVKKGNTNLLAEIDQALNEIKRDGNIQEHFSKMGT